jgi:ubiquitin C-terminal hydrolase
MINNNQMNFNFMNMNQIYNNSQMNNNFQINQNTMYNMFINQINTFNQSMMNLMNQFQNNNFLNNSSKNNSQINIQSYNAENINDLINIESTNEIVELLKNNKEYDNFFPLIGLQNVGLTCYMNSILQCLLHIPELNYFFIKLYPEHKNKFMKINYDCETNGRLSEEYYNIVKKVFEFKNQNNIRDYRTFKYSYRNESIAPIAFNKLLSNLNPQFARYESNDAKDLLLYLFQAMHSELNYYGDKILKNVPKCNQLIENESLNFFITVNKSLNLSIFSHLFYGITKSITKCSACNNKLYNFQFIQFLSFPTFEYKDKQFNIYRGFKDFIKTEKMSGDNQCYCQFCKGLRNALVSTKVFLPPIYLLINIDYGKNKIYLPSSINFGSVIDIKDFIDNNYKGCTQYKLISVTTHIGQSGNGGHYISYCRDSNDKWYEFNDSSVSQINSEEIYYYTPYLLIYKRENEQ